MSIKQKEKESMSRHKRRFPVILHLIGWITLFILPQFFLFSNSMEMSNRLLLRLVPSTIVLASIFYLNYLVLIPWLYNKKYRWIYPIISIAVIIGFHFIMNVGINSYLDRQRENVERSQVTERPDNMRERRGPDPRKMAQYNYFILALLVSGFAYVLRVMEGVRATEKEKRELEKAHLNSELAFLKNQISPHFFFNTLNNIYSLIEIDTEDARKAVHALSKMMRYLLYESEHKDTTLGDEIEFMNNYINLMKLKLSDKVRTDIRFTEKNNDLQIPPLLFIPFIENAFKHGVSSKDESFINISVDASDTELIFTSSNSINLVKGDRPEISSGIGLENVRKRLNLLLKDRHELKVDESGGVYHVYLKIRLR